LPASSSYQLCSSQVAAAVGDEQSATYQINSTVGQTNNATSGSVSYQLGSGFQRRKDDCSTTILEPVEYMLEQDVMGAAGVNVSSSSYQLVGTLGETAVQCPSKSSNYRLGAGFWAGCADSDSGFRFRLYLPFIKR